MAEVDVTAPGGTFAGSTTDRGRTPGGRFNGDGISGFVAQVLDATILWIGVNPPTSTQYVLWINTEDGRWYGRWDDGDSTQWADLSLPFGEGLPGPRGPQGERGLTGSPGQGIPTGGATDQILVKLDGTDYNTYWGDRPDDGLSVLNGTGVPSDVSDGVDGEFFINTTAWDIYGPKTAGAWGSATSLIGPAGPTGPAGQGVPAGGTADQILVKQSGTDYDTAWENRQSPYDIRSGFIATPVASEVMDSVPVVREVDFPANFAGSVGTIGTNPTASFVVSVKDDGVEIGTITISTGGAFTFATASGTAKTVAAGSILTFVGPGTADTTAAEAFYTLLGSVS